jgi:hypothetical protein
VNDTGRSTAPPGWWPGRLWWAGPTALALLGASVVSLVLVPGSSERTSVPQQVVVTRDEPGTAPTPDADETDQPTVVVTPSRDVESESPDDDDHDSNDDHGGDRH